MAKFKAEDVPFIDGGQKAKPTPTRPDPVAGHKDVSDAERPAWLDMGALRYEKRESFCDGLVLGISMGIALVFSLYLVLQ